MDADRKREVLAAQARFEAMERLARRYAEEGVYLFGKLPAAPDEVIEGAAAQDPAPPAGDPV